MGDNISSIPQIWRHETDCPPPAGGETKGVACDSVVYNKSDSSALQLMHSHGSRGQVEAYNRINV
jgi:hypothetical protein